MATAGYQNPHRIVSSSGRVYSPLSRPATSSGKREWLPVPTTARSTASMDFKRIPANPRFEGVAAKTDSGWSVKRAEEKFGAANSRLYRRTENFKRIKASNLAEIVRTQRPNVLILDLRSQEEYDACHIKGALNYPANMMSRSMYQFTPEILQYRNKEGCLMVIYDSEERLSSSVGTLWYEKAIENFVVLKGGMAALVAENADCLEGDAKVINLENMPPSPAKTAASRASTARPASTSQIRNRPASAGMASANAAPLSVPRPAGWSPIKTTARIPPSYQNSMVSMRDSWNIGSV